MVHLAFKSPLAGSPREVSGEAFTLRGGQLEKQPQQEPVAFNMRGCWELDSDRFGRLECADRVMCLFEEDGRIGEKQGPFSGLAVAGDLLRSGDKVIATLRGTYWQSAATRRAWPRIRLVSL
jgi:hypothetical protein